MASKISRTSSGSSPAVPEGSSPVGWAELPQDLLRAIMWRVVASEGSWRRRSTVACAGICRYWRSQVEEFFQEEFFQEEFLGVPGGSGMVAFLLSSDPPAKLMRDLVKHAMRDPKGKVMNNIAKAADGLVMSLATQISKMTSSLGSMGDLEASQEHAESPLLQIFRFENKQLSRADTEATFELLITKLLLGILDKRPLHIYRRMQPPLNILLFKILDNVDRTSSFVVLISLLRPSKQPSLAGNHEFHNLVIQCLARYTSDIKSLTHSVDLDSVLFSIHEYLQELGMCRIRAAIDNSPPQMILTFLQKLVKHLGTVIEFHLSRIPRGTKPQAIIVVYINHYLRNPGKKGGTVKSGGGKKGEGTAQAKPLKDVVPEDVEPAEMSLEEIESRIGSVIQADTISQSKSAVWKERLEGEDIWRFVGKLTDAQKSMLDDRFKWKAREMARRKEGRPGEAGAASRRSVRENGSDMAEQSGEVSRSISGPIFARENYGHSEVNVDRHLMSHTSSSTDWNEALNIISFGSPEQSIEGMKVVCHKLGQATNDPDGSGMEDLVKVSDRLVLSLADKVAKTFDFSSTGASSRSCKYVLNTLMQTFQNRQLAHAVKEGTLDRLITELLLRLLDERVPRMDDGSQLLKALNVLMLKILDNADRSSSFVVLINLLRPLDPSRWPAPAVNETVATRNQKFSELVVKCLIKLTKVLESTIYDVDLDRILQSIHVYLQELGMEEIRRRAGADDKPLRMVKTVLHELVKLRGTAIKGHLSMVPIDMEPQPIILAYIDLNLQTLAAARMLTPSGPVGQTHWGDSTANNPTPATHSADAQLKQELAAVFKKIGDKQTCTIGLYELYRITQLYPQVDIFAQLQNASEAFRTYIRDGLAQMEKSAAAGRTPSTLLMATPPPAVLNLSSPKLAPLSPVHTNSTADVKTINAKPEPTSFSLPPSYSEDDRVVSAMSSRGPHTDALFAEQRNERLLTGVSGGTLDAIRERMRSIQLAAASGNLDSGNKPPFYTNGNVPYGQNPNTTDNLSMDDAGQAGVRPMDEKALSGLQARMERLKSGTLEPL